MFPHKSPRNLKAYSASITTSSAFLGFDSDIGSEMVSAQEKAYPLPKPSCSPEPSMNFGVDDQGDFASFRAVEEGNYNLWSRTSCPGSEVFAMQASAPLHQLIWDGDKQENRRHPCHRLPLPPAPSKSYHNHQSNWKKGKLLERGTFGLAYAGFNSEKGQMCAIKEVSVVSDDHNSTECLKQLNQEIALLSELSHPNIVQYYESKMVENKLSVYLEYVSGGSIRKLLTEYGPFAEPVIQSYTKQILCGLAYLHRRNTVYRDIKGANILVDPNGEIKLADFGMAKHLQTKSGSSILSFKGSPYWMAPEVIMNTSIYSLAVDIWSLGCTVIEMATSKPPWSQHEGV